MSKSHSEYRTRPPSRVLLSKTRSDRRSHAKQIYCLRILFPESLEIRIPSPRSFMGMLWSLTAFTTPTLLCIAAMFRFMAIYMPYSYKDLVNIRSATFGEFYMDAVW